MARRRMITDGPADALAERLVELHAVAQADEEHAPDIGQNWPMSGDSSTSGSFSTWR